MKEFYHTTGEAIIQKINAAAKNIDVRVFRFMVRAQKTPEWIWRKARRA
jgi:hypothetical protein